MRDNLLFAQAGLVSCYLIRRSLHGKAGFPMNAIRFAATGVARDDANPRVQTERQASWFIVAPPFRVDFSVIRRALQKLKLDTAEGKMRAGYFCIMKWIH